MKNILLAFLVIGCVSVVYVRGVDGNCYEYDGVGYSRTDSANCVVIGEPVLNPMDSGVRDVVAIDATFCTNHTQCSSISRCMGTVCRVPCTYIAASPISGNNECQRVDTQLRVCSPNNYCLTN